MANDDLPLVWEQFLKSARIGTEKETAHGIKIALCKTALKISDKLIETNYNSGDRFDIWFEYILRIFAVFDENDDIIKRTVREYFLSLHSGEVSDFSIEFTVKAEGSSIGKTCDVKFSGVSHRFYIKFHERGPRTSSITTVCRYSEVDPPLIQEIFVYKLLSLIKVAEEVHFPFPITFDKKKALLIATEEIKFTTAEELNIETADTSAMILVYFLQYILLLEDVEENRRNFGQTGEGKPIIVDFWVTNRDDYVVPDAQVEDFYGKPSRGSTQLISAIFKKVTKEKRKEVIHGAIEEWKLLNKIDEAKSFVDFFVTKNRERLEVSGDLNQYVCDIKSNVEKFSK